MSSEVVFAVMGSRCITHMLNLRNVDTPPANAGRRASAGSDNGALRRAAQARGRDSASKDT